MATSRRRSGSRQQFSRTDRISETIREIVANELERVGDDRVDMVTVTAVQVDADLHAAKVFYSAMTAEQQGRLDEVAEALGDLRWRIQKVVNGALTTRKTPQIEFHPDEVLAAALRIDDIISQRVQPDAE